MSNDEEYIARIRIHKETLGKAIMSRITDIEDFVLSDSMKYLAATIYLDCVEPIVPKKFGTLRASARVPDKKYKGDYAVIYNAPYAAAQYSGKTTGPIRHWTTPDTKDHWNHHLSNSDRSAMYQLMAEEIIRSIKHG